MILRFRAQGLGATLEADVRSGSSLLLPSPKQYPADDLHVLAVLESRCDSSQWSSPHPSAMKLFTEALSLLHSLRMPHPELNDYVWDNMGICS